jgi:DNA-binding NtrC family response regulator
MVGAGDKSHVIAELPVRLVRLDTGAEAIRSLKQEKIDTLISRWNLVDVPDGKLLENVINASPFMPTIALIEPGNFNQEIQAAQLGVTAIINDDVDDEHFREIVIQLLGIETMAAISTFESR